MTTTSRPRLPAFVLMLGGTLVIALAAYRWFNQSPAAPALPSPQPITRGPHSVLLVTLDTTRADHLEPYGYERLDTPALQQLADEGVVFDRAYSVAPITLPAHTSIHSGLYPPQHGVRNNGLHYVPDGVETLAEVLGDRGYRTAAFVSAAVLDKRYNLDQGFEVYDDDLSAGRDRHPRMVADRPAEATVDAASVWLDGVGADQRFFLWVHFYDPHAAYSPPPPYRDLYREALYDGEIAYMDAQLGRLLAHHRLSDRERTIVMVIGDHGESLGEHGEQTHALLAYDSTLRVPWIARIPGGPVAARISYPVSQTDLAPTILDLVGLETARGPGGNSLVPLLEGQPPRTPASLYSETLLPFYTYGWEKLRVFRQGNWKWIQAPTPELYNLDKDPHELSNLADQNPGLSHDLRRDLDAFLAAVENEGGESNLELDTEALERLRSLGYLSLGSGTNERDNGPRPDPKDVIHLHVGLERARQLANQRLYEQAEAELRKVLKEDSGNLAALIDLGTALAEQGKLDEAVQVAEQALSLDRSYPRLQLMLAGLEERRGAYDKALTLADGALELDPNYLEAILRKAALLARLGRRDDADAVLTEGLGRFADHPRLNAAYANLIERPRGDRDAAERRLRDALDRDPFMVYAWSALGQILEQQGRSAEARGAYQEGLKRGPDDANLHGRLGLMLARAGSDAEAERHLREALRLSPEFHPELHVALGAWLADRGRLAEAQAEYEKVLTISPSHPGARNNRAIAYYRAGRADEARSELEALVADHPNHLDAHNNLSAIALESGDWARAETHARKALALNTELPEAWNNLGFALAEQNRLEPAGTAYERALAIEPDYWQARFNRGILLKKRADWQGAADEFEWVLARLPGIPLSYFELGGLYAGPLSDPERARRYYNGFLKLIPTGPQAEEIRKRIAAL